VVLSLMPVVSTPACDGLRDGPKGIVREVVDGDTVLLDNGLAVRLIGIQAPKLGLGRDGFTDWPKGNDAKAALTRLLLGQAVMLRYGGEEVDRHGRALAQVYVTGTATLWAQQHMLATGMARVYSFADNRACLPELMAAETKARAAALGIWGDPYYRVRRADRPAEIAALAGHYELVEGRVLKAEKTGGLAYLNFGRFWKDDLTVVMDARALRLFAQAGIDPLKFGGALLRVRGWVDDRDGPRIAVTHPEQIEILASP
jgi:endonuclease YncB( thermonuclease family)